MQLFVAACCRSIAVQQLSLQWVGFSSKARFLWRQMPRALGRAIRLSFSGQSQSTMSDGDCAAVIYGALVVLIRCRLTIGLAHHFLTLTYANTRFASLRFIMLWLRFL